MNLRKLYRMMIPAVAVLLAACGGEPEVDLSLLPTVAELPSVTPSPTETNTSVPTDMPTATATETVTPTVTATATASATPTATENIEATIYIATQNFQATLNAENEATVAALLEAGLLPTATDTPIPVEEFQATVFYTQDGSVRVRSCQFIRPDCGDVVNELPVGVPVTVTGTTQGDSFRNSAVWYQVDISGEVGYIHSSLLGELPPPSEAELTLTAVAATVLGGGDSQTP